MSTAWNAQVAAVLVGVAVTRMYLWWRGYRKGGYARGFEAGVRFEQKYPAGCAPQACEGCHTPATTQDNEGVPLCAACADSLRAEALLASPTRGEGEAK